MAKPFDVIAEYNRLWEAHAPKAGRPTHSALRDLELVIRKDERSKQQEAEECKGCEAWNLICPKCGAAKGEECGWPTNCPTGQDKRLPQKSE